MAELVSIFETQGDFWIPVDQRTTNPLNFFSAFYFAVVTMSTVGYGDITPKTVLGRITIVLFIATSLVILSLQVSKVIEIMNSRKMVIGHRPFNFRKKIVLITGSFNPSTLDTLINNIFYESNQDLSVPPSLVLVHPEPLSNEIRQMLANPIYAPHVHFTQDNPMSRDLLSELQVEKFNSVLIMCDRDCINREEEDSKNVLIYWAIKNYAIHLPIFIQILTQEMKKTLLSMPKPEYVSVDQVVCLDEMKQSIFAQNCIYPGTSTLLSNLVCPHSPKHNKEMNWLGEYLRGCSYNLYFHNFGDTLAGTRFGTFVENFYKRKPHMLVIGILRNKDGENCIHLAPFEFSLEAGDVAIVLANKKSDSKILVESAERGIQSIIKATFEDVVIEMDSSIKDKFDKRVFGRKPSTITEEKERRASKFDPSNYITVETELEIENYEGILGYEKFSGWPFTLTSKVQACSVLEDHIIVCGHVNELFWFVAALRMNYLKDTKWYKKIVILDPCFLIKNGSEEQSDRVDRRRDELSRFPDVFFFKGSALSREDLRAVNVKKASKVVIFSHRSGKASGKQGNLVDSDSMFICLNVGKETNCHKPSHKNTRNNIVMELLDDSNIVFMDIASHLKTVEDTCEDGGVSHDGDGYRTPFFASGKVFSAAVFDNLMAQACFNPVVIPIIRLFASAPGSKHPQNSHLALIPPASIGCEGDKDSLKYDFRNTIFGKVVAEGISRRMLIFAIFREPSSDFKVDRTVHPFVICMPKADIVVTEKDQLYALVDKQTLLSLSKVQVEEMREEKKGKGEIEIEMEEESQTYQKRGSLENISSKKKQKRTPEEFFEEMRENQRGKEDKEANLSSEKVSGGFKPLKRKEGSSQLSLLREGEGVISSLGGFKPIEKKDREAENEFEEMDD